MQFELAGVGVDVQASPTEAQAVISGRLHCLSPARSDGAARVRYDLNRGSASLASGGRLVYEHGGASVRYMPAAGLVTAGVAGVAVLRACPAEGWAEARLEADSAEALWAATHPLLTIALLELLKAKGRFGLHAGGALRGRDVVLFPGASGSGKSTLTLTLGLAGWPLLGDDTVFLEPGLGAPIVHAFPDEIDLTGATVTRFPGVEVNLLPPWPGCPKRQLPLDRLPCADAPPSAAAALLLPSIGGVERTTLEPLDPGAALRALAANVLLTDTAASQAHLNVLGTLVRSVPAFRLRLATDFDRIPDVVAAAVGG